MVFMNENMLQKAGADLPELNTAFLANNLWLLIATSMVFLTNAGLALFKIANGTCVSQSMATLMIPIVAYWFIGYSLMYGDSVADGFLYSGGLFFDPTVTAYMVTDAGLVPTVDFLFQAMFATVACSIATMGSKGYANSIAYTAAIAAFIYPIAGSWKWNGGWLDALGFVDFAGSSIVFLVGGIAALVNGSFDETKKPIANYKKNMFAVATMLMVFGHIGFNAGSQLAMDQWVPYVAVNTMLSVGGAVITHAILTNCLDKDTKTSSDDLLLASISGAIGISAGCGDMNLAGAFFVGVVSGLINYFVSQTTTNILHKIAKISAISGAWGTVNIGLWGTAVMGDGAGMGMFNGGGINLLLVQALGAGVYTIWSGATGKVASTIINGVSNLAQNFNN